MILALFVNPVSAVLPPKQQIGREVMDYVKQQLSIAGVPRVGRPAN